MIRNSYKYWLYHRVLFNQSVATLPTVAHSRILMISFWMFAMVINACFSGVLLASLLKDQPVKQINTLDDLISHRTVKAVTVRGALFKSNFDYEDAEGNELFKFNDRIVFTSSDNVTSRETVDKVIAGKYALIINRMSIESIVARRGKSRTQTKSQITRAHIVTL